MRHRPIARLVHVMMGGLALAVVAGTLGASGSKEPARATHSAATFRGGIARAFGKLPLSFEPNLGQADPGVGFISHGRGFALFMSSDTAVLSLMHVSAGST